MNGELNTAKAVAVLNKYLLQQQCGNRMELQFFSEELQAQIEALSLASVRNELVTQLANLGKCLCDEKLVNCSANANCSEVAIDFLEMHLESLEGRQFKEGFI